MSNQNRKRIDGFTVLLNRLRRPLIGRYDGGTPQGVSCDNFNEERNGQLTYTFAAE